MSGTILLIPVALLASLIVHLQLGRMSCAERSRPPAAQTRTKGKTVAGLVLIVMTVMFLAWFQISFRTYLPTWIESQGQSLAAAGRTMFVFAVALGVGSLLGGALSDRVGRWQLLALCLALIGPAQWLFVGASGVLQMAIVAVLGTLIGATFPVSIVMAQETWTRGVGIASGLVMGLGWVPGGLGASLTGYVADRFSLATGLRLLVLPAALGTACVLAYAVVRRTPDVADVQPERHMAA
jgi:FSR family fosmidomycin resistance protein-like MFS transporter